MFSGAKLVFPFKAQHAHPALIRSFARGEPPCASMVARNHRKAFAFGIPNEPLPLGVLKKPIRSVFLGLDHQNLHLLRSGCPNEGNTTTGICGRKADRHGSDIARRAKALVSLVETPAHKRDIPKDLATDFDLWGDFIEGTVRGREPFDRIEAAATREMKRLARTLPVWASFGEGVPGFGEGSLAMIVGEAGDLSAYPKKGHLWKRMGVAVIGAGDGVADHRQGNPGSEADSKAWIAEGYNRVRRSRLFVLGDSLLKPAGPYRDVYLSRKARELEKAAEEGLIVAPAASIPKGKASGYRSKGVIHLRAQRYMEKRLLKDLWQAWRGAGDDSNADKAFRRLPAPSEAES